MGQIEKLSVKQGFNTSLTSRLSSGFLLKALAFPPFLGSPIIVAVSVLTDWVVTLWFEPCLTANWSQWPVPLLLLVGWFAGEASRRQLVGRTETFEEFADLARPWAQVRYHRVVEYRFQEADSKSSFHLQKQKKTCLFWKEGVALAVQGAAELADE